jgi:hypothetical protein
MTNEEYLRSLQIDDEVIFFTPGGQVGNGVVTKITPTGLIKVVPNYNKSIDFTFNKDGKLRGGTYGSYLVNKYDEKAMSKIRLIKAKSKMNSDRLSIISFLTNREEYNPKNAEILAEIKALLDKWR